VLDFLFEIVGFFAWLVGSLAIIAVPVVSLAAIPGWIAFIGTRDEVVRRWGRFCRREVAARAAREMGKQKDKDKDKEKDRRREYEWSGNGADFHLDLVLSAVAAAVVCAALYLVIVGVASQYLPIYKNASEANADKVNEVTRISIQLYSAPLAAVAALWLSCAYYQLTRIVLHSPIVYWVTRIYVFAYIALGIIVSNITVPLPAVSADSNPAITLRVNTASVSVDRTPNSETPPPAGSNVTILKEMSYGLVNMFRNIISGPLFIADEIAKSSQLEQWLSFLFLFSILFCSLKYFTYIVLQVYKLKSGADAFDVTAIEFALNAVILLLCTLLSVTTLQIDFVSLGVFTALIGAGVSISFRDLLNNFFSGVLLNLDKSIKKGDVIRIADGTTGTVHQISLRYTLLKTKDKMDVLIPNSLLVQNRFDNLTRSEDEVRLSLKFIVGQTVDIDRIERLVIKACRYVPEVSAVAGQSPALFFLGPSEHGNQFDLRFWVNHPEPGTAKLQSDVAKAIYKEFKRDDVALPMIYNMNFDGGKSLQASIPNELHEGAWGGTARSKGAA
jgi:small-conductance mechanosensitive channel